MQKNIAGFGLLSTIILGMIVFFVDNLAFYISYELYDLLTDRVVLIEELDLNGDFVSLHTLVASVMCSSFLVLVVWLKTSRIIDYFSLFRFTNQAIFIWSVFIIVFIVILSFAAWLVTGSVTGIHFKSLHESVSNIWFLWVALVVLGPICEELLFRGFLYKGLAYSFVGVNGAIVVTSLLWAASHTQYGITEQFQVLCIGIVLGVVRSKSNSLLLTISLHSIWNALLFAGPVFDSYLISL